MPNSIKLFFTPLTDTKSISIIIIIGIIVYFLSLFNGFVIDDTAQILNNPAIHSIRNFFNFFTGGTFYNGGGELIGVYYKPITVSFFSFVYTIFGPNPFWYHLFQLFLHILNASILHLVLNKFFKSPISLFLALIFLIHPLNSESVYYISAVQETLFFFFGILGLWLIINYKNDKYLILAIVSLSMSLLSKETGTLFILTSILYSVLFNRKIFIKVLISSIMITTIYGILRFSTIGLLSKPLNAPIGNLSLIERIINIPFVLFFYLKNFLIPIHLASSYQWVYTKIDVNNFLIPLTVEILLIFLIVALGSYLYIHKFHKQQKVYLFFVLILLLGLVFHSQIIPLDATVAERWFYFPILGVLGLLGIIIEVIVKRKYINLAIFIAVFILFLFSGRTILRGFDWKDNITLANHDILISKDAYDLEMRIGLWYFEKGELNEAKIHMDKSVELYPYITNLNNLGIIYLRIGEFEKAKVAFLRALSIADIYVTYDNLAALGVVYGDPNENIKFIESALKKYPQDSKLWLDLAIIEYENNMIDQAKIHASNAYYLDKSELTSGIYQLIMNELLLKVDTVTGKITIKENSP